MITADSPPLAGPSLITGHMASPAIQTSMVYFSPFRSFLLALAVMGSPSVRLVICCVVK